MDWSDPKGELLKAGANFTQLLKFYRVTHVALSLCVVCCKELRRVEDFYLCKLENKSKVEMRKRTKPN
jgi:hypothetical protein